MIAVVGSIEFGELQKKMLSIRLVERLINEFRNDLKIIFCVVDAWLWSLLFTYIICAGLY